MTAVHPEQAVPQTGVPRPAFPAPLVSVILPVRDRAHCVGRAIASVLAQDYARIELIVVDDGSMDGTAAVVQGFGSGVRLIRQQAAGAYAARNRALRAARGELIAFIDSDDAWLPAKLTRQVPLMRAGVGLVFGDVIHVRAPREGGPRTGQTSFAVAPPCRGRAEAALARCNFVPTSTVLVRRSALEAVGGFSEAQPLSADYLAWFRIARRAELDFVPFPVAEYSVHADGISADLGRSLAARLALFQGELENAEPEEQALLRRLIFNLSLSLALAALRGRARSVSRPMAKACQAGWRAARFLAAPWTATFVARQVGIRVRRLLA
jgi:glycosyltransferase involved in cell wall biosynthesis